MPMARVSKTGNQEPAMNLMSVWNLSATLKSRESAVAKVSMGNQKPAVGSMPVS